MTECRLLSPPGKEQIKRLDVEIETLVIDYYDQHFHGEEYENDWTRDDLKSFGSVGHCIAKNKSIKEIRINSGDDLWLTRIPDREWEAFFRGVSQSGSIKRIFFDGCCLDGHILKLFDIPNLETVEFNRCIITSQTESAVRRAPCLRELALDSYLNVTDAGSMVLLKNSFVESSSLEILDLEISRVSQMTEEGWEVMSDILSSRATFINTLCLSGSQIDDKSVDELTRGLTYNTTLEVLELSCLPLITEAGWLSIFSSLENSNLPLNSISIKKCDRINDVLVSSFCKVCIAKNETIEGVELECEYITAAGWATLSVAFLTPMPNLKRLWMGNTNFDDDALVAFARGLYNKPSLKGMHLVRANISMAGWEEISNALCNTCSLDAIRESNHTLLEIEVYHSYCSRYCPPNIKKLLEINRSGTPLDVTRTKIINYSDKITTESLVDDHQTMQMKLVPSLISWLGKDGYNHNAVYHFVRNQSYLLAGPCNNTSDS
ncbi:hypothetical protein ACHAWX_004876 [Stephanocyclus meneghinianus]